jgi:hypothetical protein
MELREILEHEASLTQPIRDEVADFEERSDAYLNELWDPLEEEDDDEEEDLNILPTF